MEGRKLIWTKCLEICADGEKKTCHQKVVYYYYMIPFPCMIPFFNTIMGKGERVNGLPRVKKLRKAAEPWVGAGCGGGTGKRGGGPRGAPGAELNKEGRSQ